MLQRVIYYDKRDPGEDLLVRQSVFLAGPTNRGSGLTQWRQLAITFFQPNFDGVLIIPEFEDGRFAEHVQERFGAWSKPAPNLPPHMKVSTYNIIDWETYGIRNSTLVMFWMPFSLDDHEEPRPGYTTRGEVAGILASQPKRCVLGMPPDAFSAGYIRYHAAKAGIPIYETLLDTVNATLRQLHLVKNDEIPY